MVPQQLGDFRIDRVVEGEGPYFALDFLVPGMPAGLADAHADWLRPHFIDPADGRVIMAFQSFVLRTPHHTILVDACTGNDKERHDRPQWHRQKHPYLDRLKAAGVTPDDVDFVFCTHLHADHVGWNTVLDNGRWVPTFPNARYLFQRDEYAANEAAHRRAVASGAPPIWHGSFEDSVLPIVAAGRAVMVDSDHAIEDGVRLEAAYGHTPGNCLMHAASGGRRALFIGDIMHTPAQFAAPQFSSRFCADPALSAKVRVGLCETYAESDTTILAAHFPTPGVGRIVRHRDAFRLAI